MDYDISRISSQEFIDLANKDMLFQKTGGSQGQAAVFSGEDMKRFKLHGSHLYQLDLSHKDFTGQDLSNASFFNCDLSYSVFDGAVLDQAAFQYCNACHTSFKGTKGTSPNFSFMKLDSTDFSQASFVSPDFSFSIGSDTIMRQMEATGCILNNVKLPGLYAQDANFTYGSLRQFDCNNGNLSNAVMDHIDGSRAVFNNVNAAGSSWDGAVLLAAQMRSMDLDHAYMPSVVIKGAKLDVVLAQYGPVNADMDSIIYNVSNDQLSMPKTKAIHSLKSFEREIAQKDKTLKPIVEAFRYAQKNYNKKYSGERT